MGNRVSISRRSAQALLDALAQLPAGSHSERAHQELFDALKPKKAPKLARARKVARKKTKREQTAEIRDLVFERADGFCEACAVADRPIPCGALEMDHFFPKGRTPQTVETCWAIGSRCHLDKTKNHPSPSYWLKVFWSHAISHGYTEEAARTGDRLDSIALMSAAESVGRP